MHLYVCYCMCVCGPDTQLAASVGLIRGKEEEGRTTSVSQVVTQRLAIHSGIALTSPEAQLFIAASSLLTHSHKSTQ